MGYHYVRIMVLLWIKVLKRVKDWISRKLYDYYLVYDLSKGGYNGKEESINMGR